MKNEDLLVNVSPLFNISYTIQTNHTFYILSTFMFNNLIIYHLS